MSFTRCPNPAYPKDDRHVATLTDDLSQPYTNDDGEIFYLKIVNPICQGCGLELTAEGARGQGGRWHSITWLIQEEPY